MTSSAQMSDTNDEMSDTSSGGGVSHTPSPPPQTSTTCVSDGMHPLANTSHHHIDRPSSSASTSTPSPTPAVGSDLRHLSQTIMNSLQWINDFSPTNIFQNFLSTNPFRRRNSSKHSVDQTIAQKTIKSMVAAEDDTSADRPVAHFLNGTLIATAKSLEFIELANFGIVEIDHKESGVGHDFQLIETLSANWCDSCGEFMWSSVTSNHNSGHTLAQHNYGKYLRCSRCKYICHPRCRELVRLDCQGVCEKPYLLREMSRSSSPLFAETLASKIHKYNEKRRAKGSGLGITIIDESKQSFRGFLRVHLNLSRPINVISGRRPPSIYDIINEEETNGTLIKRRTLTSFYMPRDTVKNIHITSENTSLHVIKAMLKKFKVVDNPQKFALYLRSQDPVNSELTVLKRIGDNEKPLLIQLDCDEDMDEKQVVLQENDTGDIAWDAFEIPELNNFIKILDREEKEHLAQVFIRYRVLKETLMKLIEAEERATGQSEC
ncbi:unnamed protein product [Medioppia subpectinata]|uniref:Ras association domain-containing protein 1 n=1 Tax=Medioppia subpectinata TaxID=1979941 RepID=A0A7R9Q6R2_9ACAR|nr:unnamed protein product [Medioppia subpectinata]CAG2113536.1 unnamed protein product [Medioppia subpectinata]